VSNLLDSGLGSLRQAILDTPAGGTVDFQPGLAGSITLTSGELAITKDLTIAGPGSTVLKVSGNNASRVFDITGTFAAPVTVAISGLTIGDGINSQGGGIYIFLGTVTATADFFSGNSGAVGGAIYNNGTLTLTNSTFSSNSATGGTSDFVVGGCIANFGTLAMTGCVLQNNSTTGAGGVFYNSGPATVTYSTLRGNSATGGGGGAIINSSGGTLTLSNSTLSGNSVTSATGLGNPVGGGIYNLKATLTVTNCTFNGNTASTGIPGLGGAILNSFGTVTITSSTLSGNAAGSGGGLYANPGAVTTLRNTIVAGNTAPNFPDLFATVTSQGHNLIGNGSGGTGFTATDLVGTAASPIDPLLGPLQDNGGPTQTMALLPGSPAIDAGDNTDAPPFDQRGPGFPRIAGGFIDIGAFEVQPAVAPAVQSVAINDGAAQRSLVTRITVTFTTVVTLEPGAFELLRQGHGLVPVDVATEVVRDQTAVVLTFSGSHIVNGSLPDGDYTLTVLADHVHDQSGQTAAADSVTHFFRLFGDSNGNGVIDVQDLERFASTFGKSAGDPGYLAYFDYYGTGTVDFSDLAQLLRRLHKRV
jgi:hypothetical protein